MIKHRFRALGALLLGMTLVLAACGQNPASLDPDALLKEFLAKKSSTKSIANQVHIAFDITTIYEGKAQNSKADVTVETTAIWDPVIKQKTKADYNIKTDGETQKGSVVLYQMEENGKIQTYISGNELISEVFDTMDAQPVMSAEEYRQQYLAAITADKEEHYSDVEVIGTESVDGKDTIHLRGTIDTQQLISDVLNIMNTELTPEDEANIKIVFQMLGVVKDDIWIDAQTHAPIKDSVDLSTNLKSVMSLLEPMMQDESGQVKINDLQLTISETDYGAVEDFEVPKELKNSKPKVTPGPGTDTSIPL